MIFTGNNIANPEWYLWHITHLEEMQLSVARRNPQVSYKGRLENNKYTPSSNTDHSVIHIPSFSINALCSLPRVHLSFTRRLRKCLLQCLLPIVTSLAGCVMCHTYQALYTLIYVVFDTFLGRTKVRPYSIYYWR